MNREAPGQDAESSLMEHLLELRPRHLVAAARRQRCAQCQTPTRRR